MHNTELDSGFSGIRALGSERFSAESRNYRYPIDSYTFLQTTMLSLRSTLLSSERRNLRKLGKTGIRRRAGGIPRAKKFAPSMRRSCLVEYLLDY